MLPQLGIEAIRLMQLIQESHCLTHYESREDVKRRYPEVRRLLATRGTEGGRRIHGDNCWIEAMARGIIKDWDEPSTSAKRIVFVISDIRFPNELEFARILKARTYCMKRAQAEATMSNHESERYISYFAKHVDNIENNGDFFDGHNGIMARAALREKAKSIIEQTPEIPWDELKGILGSVLDGTIRL
jgi:hypothetical protein